MSRAVSQGIYLGGVFLGKLGKRENNNKKKKPGWEGGATTRGKSNHQ